MPSQKNTIRKDDIILGKLSKNNFRKKNSEYHNLKSLYEKLIL